MEVCYLLLYGDLPNADQKRKFEHDITYHTMVHEQMHNFIEGLRRDSHPMAVMVGMVGALSAFYHDSTDITNPRHRMVAVLPDDREDAHARGLGVQVLAGPAVHLPAQRPAATPRTSCT